MKLFFFVVCFLFYFCINISDYCSAVITAGQDEDIPESDAPKIKEPTSATASNLPNHLERSMTFKGQQYELNLTKCGHMHSDTPLIFVADKISTRLLHTRQPYAAYNDLKNGVSVIAILNQNNVVEIAQGVMANGKQMLTFSLTKGSDRSSHANTFEMEGDRMHFVEEDMTYKHAFNDLVLQLNSTKAPLKPRNKRQSFLGTFTVETLIVTDYSVYNRFYFLSTKTTAAEKNLEAQSNLIYYYTNIANGVNQRYATITNADFAIVVRLVGIYISTDPASSPYTENSFFKYVNNGETFVDAINVYTAYKKWVTMFAINNGRFFDQATMFTNYKMHIGFSNGIPIVITGIAHIGSMCSISTTSGIESTSTSLNVDRGLFASMGTMAHEMAHNLNSNHDSENNPCTYKDQYIMAAGPGPLDQSNFNNIFRFSSCSPPYMSSLLRDFQNRQTPNCLNIMSGPSFNPPVDQRMPGLKYSLDEQCRIINGPDSYYCAGDHQDPCFLLQCFNTASKLCLSLFDVRAFDGSLCGNKKWCLAGKCVFNMQAPASPKAMETCIYGDYKVPFAVLSNPSFSCRLIQRGSADISQCYDANYTNARCCDSCRLIREMNPPGCPYGDKDPNYCRQAKRERCYEDTFLSTCCNTCASLRQNIPGCEYGDRYPTSCGITSNYCYQSANICCETCSRYVDSMNPTCRYGDRVTWCATSTPLEATCSKEPINCCKTCLPFLGVNRTTTLLPACRDMEVSFCSGIQASQCYTDNTLAYCCATCARYRTGPKGCEYGNLAPWCSNTVTSPQSCLDNNVLINCCLSCSRFMPVTTSTVSPDACRDTDISYCNSRRASDCYPPSIQQYCCPTCRRLKTGPLGCEYGNRADWCASFVIGATSCSDRNVIDSCCFSCAQFAAPTPATNTPACKDQAFWCSSIYKGQCYDQQTETTCCSTCLNYKQNNQPACRYGDKYAWCAAQFCPQEKSNCCFTCSNTITQIKDNNALKTKHCWLTILIFFFISSLV